MERKLCYNVEKGRTKTMRLIDKKEFEHLISTVTVHHNTYHTMLRYAQRYDIEFTYCATAECAALVYFSGYLEDGVTKEYIVMLFQIAKGDVIGRAMDEVTEYIKSLCSGEREVLVTPEIYTLGRTNEEIGGYNHKKYVLKTKGIQYFDPHVKMIMPEDQERLTNLCSPWYESEDHYIKRQAGFFGTSDISYEMSRGIFLLGYYLDGELVGVASYWELEPFGSAYLMDLFVSPDHHRKGIGSALVKSAITRHHNKDWIYQISPGNYKSGGLAESWGFEYKGDQFFPATVTHKLS